LNGYIHWTLTVQKKEEKREKENVPSPLEKDGLQAWFLWAGRKGRLWRENGVNVKREGSGW